MAEYVWRSPNNQWAIREVKLVSIKNTPLDFRYDRKARAMIYGPTSVYYAYLMNNGDVICETYSKPPKYVMQKAKSLMKELVKKSVAKRKIGRK